MEMNRDNYRDYDAINYSKLSQLARNPSKVDEEKDWHDGFAFGTLVDYMCFSPDKVDEEFHVSQADRKPSSTAKELADWILNKSNLQSLKVENNKIVGYEDVEYGRTKVSLDELLEEAEEAVGSSTSFEKYGGVDYLKDQIESQDKHVVSSELYEKAKRAHQTLKTHKFTRRYFDPDKNIEIQFQVPILWKPGYYKKVFNDIQAKSMLDIVIFDHENKTILPVDLKTTSSSAFMFEKKIVKWRYDLQASYYTDGLRYRVDNHNEISDYDILPFEFIVISSKNLEKPLIYQMSENDLLVGREGGILSYSGRSVKGWTDLIRDLLWHQENNKWEYSREIYENNGKVEVDIFK